MLNFWIYFCIKYLDTNYRYLQQLRQPNLVLDLPKVSYMNILFQKLRFCVLSNVVRWYIVSSSHFWLIHFQGLSMHSPLVMTYVSLGCNLLSTIVRYLWYLIPLNILLSNNYPLLCRKCREKWGGGGGMTGMNSNILYKIWYSTSLCIPFSIIVTERVANCKNITPSL